MASESGVVAKRVAEYLPEKTVEKTGNKKAPETVLACSYSQWTGKFMTLADNLITSDNTVTSGAKDNLVNECTNTGLISALMLTIVVPMSFDSVTDWLEEDYTGSGYAFVDGYIGQAIGATAAENAVAFLNDFSLLFYVFGTFGYLASTILTVIMLLCVGELGTDMGCEEYLRGIGHSTRAPYLLFMAGCGFAIPAGARYACTIKTLPGLIILGLILGSMSFMVMRFSYIYVSSCIKAHNKINEFSDLNLSHQEAQDDVEAWFKHSEKSGGTIQDCLHDLSAMIQNKDSEVIVGLDGISTQRVSLLFHKMRAESLGISLSPSDLYRLSCPPAE